MVKQLFVGLSLLGLALIQTCFLPHFSSPVLTPHLVFLVVFVFNFLKGQQWEGWELLTAGIGLGLSSDWGLGFKTLILIGSILPLKLSLHLIKKKNLFSLILTFVPCFLLFLVLSQKGWTGLGLTPLRAVTGLTALNLSYNLILVVLIYQLFGYGSWLEL